ncbi:MAG: MBL fold metallo-hydrolase [Lachnospiraceae bacterium]|nr:MBL fold metallo-hydrolase [Lachnospiraceae bacterium]
MEHVKIYRGNQIGGCVTVISAVSDGQIHRIMIDYGSSLPGNAAKEDFQYPWEKEPVDAVFFTHYHGDHVGRMLEIPEDIPLYMGEVARKVMINIHDALAKRPDMEEAERKKHEDALRLLKNENRILTFKPEGNHYEDINLPGFTIEPYSIDHSAYDAYMFMIEADDGERPYGRYRVLHTGDFRGHGRRGGIMLPIIDSCIHRFGSRSVDALVIEGTMMSRSKEKVKTETELMIEASRYLHKHKWAFLICSSTNLDSLASFYQAAQFSNRKYGRYMYVYSNYFMEQLDLYTNTAGNFTDIYKFKKIANLHDLDYDKAYQNEKMTVPMKVRDMMERFGFLAVIKPEDYHEKYIDMFMDAYQAGRIDEPPVLIWSMWNGYVNKYRTLENGEKIPNKAGNDAWIDFLDRQRAKGIEINMELHTSGHASVKMLTDVINAVDPQDKIYPMHTECAEDFKKLKIRAKLKDRIQ